ncbi:Uncharacterised protein [Nocardia africana]|uniref:Uncharacterized protein n=1 Tax=Nocardia africana TaxID=134964 RepID=A0A378X7Q6_9NOCA|nr:Uncharacterised protein [Nocardia africana]
MGGAGRDQPAGPCTRRTRRGGAARRMADRRRPHRHPRSPVRGAGPPLRAHRRAALHQRRIHRPHNRTRRRMGGPAGTHQPVCRIRGPLRASGARRRGHHHRLSDRPGHRRPRPATRLRKAARRRAAPATGGQPPGRGDPRHADLGPPRRRHRAPGAAARRPRNQLGLPGQRHQHPRAAHRPAARRHHRTRRHTTARRRGRPGTAAADQLGRRNHPHPRRTRSSPQ